MYQIRVKKITLMKLFFLIIIPDDIKNTKKSTFYDIIHNVLYLTDTRVVHDIVIPGNHCEYLAIRLS